MAYHCWNSYTLLQVKIFSPEMVSVNRLKSMTKDEFYLFAQFSLKLVFFQTLHLLYDRSQLMKKGISYLCCVDCVDQIFQKWLTLMGFKIDRLTENVRRFGSSADVLEEFWWCKSVCQYKQPQTLLNHKNQMFLFCILWAVFFDNIFVIRIGNFQCQHYF